MESPRDDGLDEELAQLIQVSCTIHVTPHLAHCGPDVLNASVQEDQERSATKIQSVARGRQARALVRSGR